MQIGLALSVVGGGGPRNPIPGLSPAAYYQFGVGVTEAGGFASAWADQSGNDRHLLQATGTNQPAYAAGVLTFDGVDNFMKAVYTADKPRTRYFVVNMVSWTAGDRPFDGAANESALIRQDTASPQIDIYTGSPGWYSANSSDLSVGTYGVICGRWAVGETGLRINNNAEIVTAAGVAMDVAGLVIGANGLGNSAYANIAVKEAVDFAADHDEATQDIVIDYLMAKFSIS